MADLEAGVAGEAAAAGLQVLGLGAGRGQKLLVRVPAEHGVLVAVHLGEHRRPPLAAGAQEARTAAPVPGPGCCTRRSRGIIGYVLSNPVLAAAG